LSTETNPVASAQTPDQAGYWLIRIWSVMLVVVLVVMGYITISTAQRYRREAGQEQRALLDPTLPEPGFVPAAVGLTTDAQASEVHVGVYVNRIVDLSIQNDTWTADFYIWFDWTDSALNPGETFELIDGQILSREKQDEYTHGEQHYAAYRVMAKITKFFDVARFPVDDHLLMIGIEDGALPANKLRYVADNQDSAVSPRVEIPGYVITHAGSLVKLHMYATTFGDPRPLGPEQFTYSQFRFGINLDRNDWEMYVKVFLGLTAAVCISLVAFFIKPSHMDSRFTVRVGAFFGAIAATIATSSLVPDTSVFTLTDMVNGVGLVTIFLSLVEATISFHMYHARGEESLAPLLDHVSLPILTVGYAAISVAIPLAAAR
jgi:hypothetical protein